MGTRHIPDRRIPVLRRLRSLLLRCAATHAPLHAAQAQHALTWYMSTGRWHMRCPLTRRFGAPGGASATEGAGRAPTRESGIDGAPPRSRWAAGGRQPHGGVCTAGVSRRRRVPRLRPRRGDSRRARARAASNRLRLRRAPPRAPPPRPPSRLWLSYRIRQLLARRAPARLVLLLLLWLLWLRVRPAGQHRRHKSFC